MSQKHKIKNLHRRIEDDAKKKKLLHGKNQEMYEATMVAMDWFKRGNIQGQVAIDKAMAELKRLTTGILRFEDWLALSPFAFLRTLGQWRAKRKYNATRHEEVLPDIQLDIDRWRVVCIYGGTESLTAVDVSLRLDIPLKRVQQILEELRGKKEEATETKEEPATQTAG